MSRRKNNIRAILIIIAIILIGFFWFWENAARGVDFIPSPIDIVKSNIPPSDSKWEKIADRIIAKETNSLEYRLHKENNIEKQFDYFRTKGHWFTGVIRYSNDSKLIYTPIIGKVNSVDNTIWYRRLCESPIIADYSKKIEYYDLMNSKLLWKLIDSVNEISSSNEYRKKYFDAVSFLSDSLRQTLSKSQYENRATYFTILNDLDFSKYYYPDNSTYLINAISNLAKYYYNYKNDTTFDFSKKTIKVQIELLATNNNWFATIVSFTYVDSGTYKIYVGYYDLEYRDLFVQKLTKPYLYKVSMNELNLLKAHDSLWFLIAEDSFWLDKKRFLQLYQDEEYSSFGSGTMSPSSRHLDSLLPIHKTINIP